MGEVRPLELRDPVAVELETKIGTHLKPFHGKTCFKIFQLCHIDTQLIIYCRMPEGWGLRQFSGTWGADNLVL